MMMLTGKATVIETVWIAFNPPAVGNKRGALSTRLALTQDRHGCIGTIRCAVKLTNDH